MTLYSAGEREPAAPIRFPNELHPQEGDTVYINTPPNLNLISFRYGTGIGALM